MAHAVDLGERLSGTEHIWFGVCPAAQKLQNNKKPTPAHVASMPGLWVDIDIRGAGHEKRDIPETREAAEAVLAACPLRPSAVVWSGAGLHAYWLFKEPLIITDDVARSEAMGLSQAWHEAFGRLHKYRLDSVFNIDRVLRLPGTMNIKPGVNAMCTALSIDGPRYLPSDFDELVDVPDISQELRAGVNMARDARPLPSGADNYEPRREITPGDTPFPNIPGRCVEGHARPRRPADFDERTLATLDVLRSESSGFRKLINPDDQQARNRSDDDMVGVRLYVNMCVNSGENPSRQVCYDIISYLRHQPAAIAQDQREGKANNGIVKALDRIPYVEGTIKKVVEKTLPPKGSGKGAPPPIPEPDDPEVKEAEQASPDAMLESVSKLLRADIRDLRRYVGTEPQEYSMEVRTAKMAAHKVLYFTAEQLANWKVFETMWFASTGSLIRSINSAPEWRNRVLAKLLDLFVDDHSTPEESTLAGQVRAALVAYLHAHHIWPTAEEAFPLEQPFRAYHNGQRRVFFFWGRAGDYMAQAMSKEAVSPRRIAQIIKRSDICRRLQMKIVRSDGTIARPYVYLVPEDIMEIVSGRPASVFDAGNTIQEEEQAPCFTEPTQ